MKKEVGYIKASTKMKLRRFQSAETEANNIVFIRMLGTEPEKLMHCILQDMYKTKNKKIRLFFQILTMSGTCKVY